MMKEDIYGLKLNFTPNYFFFKSIDMSFAMYNADANPGFFGLFFVFSPEHIPAVFLSIAIKCWQYNQFMCHW